MCLQIANQGEKYEDHREIPFQVFRWVKWSIDMGFQVNHGNGSTHGEVSIPASRTAVHKHVRKHICFSKENTWFKVHKHEFFPKHFVQIVEPLPTFQSLPINMFWHFCKKKQQFDEQTFCVHSKGV